MICHHYKTVFIHVPKTAGQSIEHLFLDLLGLTWETRAPLLLRKNETPELGPPRLAHLRAQDYVRYKYMTQEQFDSYAKFSFVRNPWDRMVSFYKYSNKSGEMEFKQYLMEKFVHEDWKKNYWFVRPQSEYIYDSNNQLMVDFVGRFENLQADFNKLSELIGIGILKLPYANKSEKKPVELTSMFAKTKKLFAQANNIPKARHRNYRDYYDEESRRLIAELYERDIKLLDYSFD